MDWLGNDDQKYKKKDVNRDSHIASSSFLQRSFFAEVRCLISAPWHMKLRGRIEFLKFDITINKEKIHIRLKLKGFDRFS